MRVLAFITSAVCGLAGGACSNVLGIEDPTPDFGGDGGSRTLVSIAIGPAPLSLPLGVCQQLTATGMFDDGSSADITAQTEFSAEGGAVTVTPTGLARAIAEGPAMVTAKLGQIKDDESAQVGAAPPDRMVFSLGDFRMAQLQRVRLHALVLLDGGGMQDATATATYATDDPDVATVSMPGQVDAGAKAGAATISACLASASGGTVTATVTAKQCQPVINELQTGSAMSPDDEWVEVLNPCTAAIDVDGWTLVYRGAMVTGTQDSNLMVTLTGQLAPGEIRLFAGPDFTGPNDGKWLIGILGQNNGGIALRSGAKDVGSIVDAVAYGAVAPAHPFIEGNPMPAMANGRTAQRLPFDGHDEDNGATDFMQLMTGTPRAFNAP